MESDTETSLLMDFAQTLGRIEGQNLLIIQEQARASQARSEQREALEDIRRDARDVKSNVDHIAARVTTMEPDVSNMKAFRAQLAIAVFFVTTAVTGAINLVWLALTHLTDIKEAFRSFLK